MSEVGAVGTIARIAPLSCVLCCSGHLPSGAELLTKEELVRLKRCIYSLQRDGLPPVTTHNIIGK